MPIIDVSTPFATVASTAVTALSIGRYPVEITVSNPTYGQLFAMVGGPLWFVPSGKDTQLLYAAYDDLPPLAPGTGYLFQRVAPAYAKKLKTALPTGVPPMIEVVYFNVDPVSVRADLTPVATLVPDLVLKSFGTIAGSPTHTQYVNQLLDVILDGKAGLYVRGGAKVGKIASSQFTLFLTGGDTFGLSPIPLLRAMPDLAGSGWTDHPLIKAVSSLSVPVDIYAELRVWDNTQQTTKPLPDGLAVRLMDHDLSGDTPLVTGALGGGNGRAELHVKNTDLEHTSLGVTEKLPDLFFEADLGASNPDPTIVADRWQSNDQHTVGLDPGYFDDFAGTRLGSAVDPLRFQIGLGFWSDLISFRPPAAVQSALKLARQSVQAIENAFEADIIQAKSELVIGHQSAPLSLDFYGVKVDQLPTGYATAEALLTFIRTNFNLFIDTKISEFNPVNPSWFDPNASPVGIVLRIIIPAFFGIPDIGDVVVGQADSKQWTVNTISDPTDLAHPLGGIRRWGFLTNPDGSHTFYTKGTDRPWAEIDYKFDWMVFRGANELWTSFQEKITNMVNSQEGSATILPAFANRFTWKVVKPLYWKPDPNNPWL